MKPDEDRTIRKERESMMTCVKCGKPRADFSSSLCEECFDNLEVRCSGCDYNVSGQCLCQDLMAASCIPTYSGKNILEQIKSSKKKR